MSSLFSALPQPPFGKPQHLQQKVLTLLTPADLLGTSCRGERHWFHRPQRDKQLHQCCSHLPSFAFGNTAVGCKTWCLVLQLISITACSSPSAGNSSPSPLTLKKPTQHKFPTFISLRIRQYRTQIIAHLCWLLFSHLVNTLWIYIHIIFAIMLFPKP